MHGDDELDFSRLSDEELMDLLAEVVTTAESVPPPVIDAAVAIHDWVDFDAEIARFEAEQFAVRATGAPLAWNGGGGSVHADLEPSGWRRVRIICSVLAPPDLGAAHSPSVELQSAAGTRQSATATDDGEFEADVAAGLWRIVASAGRWALTTPWFRI